MACSFSDFPVFVLHFGHPKPQALSANLEQVFQSASDAKQMIVDALTGLSIEIEDSNNISFKQLSDIISTQLLKYSTSNYISCNSNDSVYGENTKTVSLRQTSNSGTAFSMINSSVYINHKINRATIKVGAIVANINSGNTHRINGGAIVYCNGNKIGSASGHASGNGAGNVGFSNSFTTTLNPGDILTISIWSTDNSQVGCTWGATLSIVGVV